MLEKSSNAFLLKLQVIVINLRDSHLLVEIVGRHIKSGRAKPNPNSGEMVSRMLAYCRCGMCMNNGRLAPKMLSICLVACIFIAVLGYASLT